MGSLFSTVTSLLIGGSAAVFTIVGVVDAQTEADGASPANVSNTVIEYGATP